LYRQEKIWQRMGIELARNTVCGWIMAAAEVCMPMRDPLMKSLIASGYIQADEIPQPVVLRTDTFITVQHHLKKQLNLATRSSPNAYVLTH